MKDTAISTHPLKMATLHMKDTAISTHPLMQDGDISRGEVHAYTTWEHFRSNPYPYLHSRCTGRYFRSNPYPYLHSRCTGRYFRSNPYPYLHSRCTGRYFRSNPYSYLHSRCTGRYFRSNPYPYLHSRCTGRYFRSNPYPYLHSRCTGIFRHTQQLYRAIFQVKPYPYLHSSCTGRYFRSRGIRLLNTGTVHTLPTLTHPRHKEDALRQVHFVSTCAQFMTYTLPHCMETLKVKSISRVSDQNGVSLQNIMLDIHHSGREPSIFSINLGIVDVKCTLTPKGTNHTARSTKMPPSQSYKRRRVACQHSPDDQTLRLQAGAGEDGVIHLPSGPDRAACKRQD